MCRGTTPVSSTRRCDACSSRRLHSRAGVGSRRPVGGPGSRRSRPRPSPRWSSSSALPARRRTGISPRPAPPPTLARKYTPDVTEIYSPNATWPAVSAALQGASVVIYMGHGNGWPSRYRERAVPAAARTASASNPSAGNGDGTHQYFGEASHRPRASSSRRTRSCCSTTCATPRATASPACPRARSPGPPAGRQLRGRVHRGRRVGRRRRGATQPEPHAPLRPGRRQRHRRRPGDRPERQPARDSPSRASAARATSPRWTPNGRRRASSGRSSSRRASSPPTSCAARAVGGAGRPAIDAAALAPSLAAAGLTVHTPFIEGGTVRGGSGRYLFNVDFGDREALPDGIQASARWDRLDPGARGRDRSRAPRRVSGSSSPERIGEVVEPVGCRCRHEHGRRADACPPTPGRYRLTITLHDKDGVAYDAATQAQFPALIVRVTGDLDATIVAPDLSVPNAARPSSCRCGSATGRDAWGHGRQGQATG